MQTPRSEVTKMETRGTPCEPKEKSDRARRAKTATSDPANLKQGGVGRNKEQHTSRSTEGPNRTQSNRQVTAACFPHEDELDRDAD
jgi:hypothetical protein